MSSPIVAKLRLLLAALMIVLVAWLARYSLTAAGLPSVDGGPSLWLLDRWTGEVRFCNSKECVEVPIKR
jgi:hypothetical protein